MNILNSEHIRIFCLGGLDEPGKNCTVVQIDDDIYVIDAGVKFPDSSMPGVDYAIIDSTYLKEHKNQIKCFILTHGHDDQIGALPYFYKECPAKVYCSDVSRIYLEGFKVHNDLDIKIDYEIIEPTSDHVIGGRNVHFFHTAHNVPHSFGVAIETSLGNIVYTGDFIVDYSSNQSYLHDLNAIGRIAEKKTLLLMCPSLYADRFGYTAPNHRLDIRLPKLVGNDPKGRIFVALHSTNIFSIEEVVKYAISINRKICCYDKDTVKLFNALHEVKQCLIPPNYYLNLEDINRVRDDELVIIMSGFGEELFHKISRLALGENTDSRIRIKPGSDIFIAVAPPSLNLEVIATNAIDNMFRSGAIVSGLTGKEYFGMHASEQDLQMMISIFKPKYYLPVDGAYRRLVANAMMAVNMGIGLNHMNVFILDNGNILDITAERARILPPECDVENGDIFVDGFGRTTIENKDVIIERNLLCSNGAVIIGCAVSESQHKIVAGPDVQMRGFGFAKDFEVMQRNIAREFTNIVDEFLLGTFNQFACEASIKENLTKFLRRETGKTPAVIPLIKVLS